MLLLHQQLLPPNDMGAEYADLAPHHNILDYLEDDNVTTLLNGNITTATNTHKGPPPTPDGTFNGYPIYYQSNIQDPIYSQMHCVGDTYDDPTYWKRKKKNVDLSWQSRSCHLEFFCYDVDSKEYVVFFNPEEKSTMAGIRPETHDMTQTIFFNKTSSTEHHPFGVSLGSINQKWGLSGISELMFFPQVRYEPAPTEGFYSLPSNTVLLPFHSLAAFNPGHLVWDDFLPIFMLMQIFQLQHLDLLLMRYKLLIPRGLWAGCDWKDDRSQECHAMLKKFGPLMVRNPNAIPITTQMDPRFEVPGTQTSNLVCAKHGLIGMGSLNDHGILKGHGWDRRDYTTTHNHGKAGAFWQFRNFLIENLGIRPNPQVPAMPLLILFSEKSSQQSHRSLDFTKEINALKEALPKDLVRIEAHQMKQYTLRKQAELVSQAAIYVTGCGGGAVTATFLPRFASLVVYYGEKGGVENNRMTGEPARLDWDYFNNLYVRTHWIGQNTKRSQVSLDGFVTLIQRQVSIIQQELQDYHETTE